MHILYATDGSEGALAGARFLSALPLAAADTRIRLLTVVPNEGDDGEPALTAAEEGLGGLAPGVTITRETRRGNAAEGVLKACDEESPDLIVMGTRGLSAIPRFFLGSVAERVARHARSPVLLARPLRGALDRVVLGVDSSERAVQAATWLQELPLPEGCEVRLVTAVTSQEAVQSSRAMRMPAVAADVRNTVARERADAQERLKALAESFAASGRAKTSTELREDDPASGLLAATEAWQADLLVVGATGLSGVDRFLLGSVSEKVLRYAQCSVLVVRRPPE